MFAQIYKHLKNNGFDVYSIGQHEGICSSPYIVVKENGESEVAGTSLINDTVELLIYYPVGRYSELSSYKKNTWCNEIPKRNKKSYRSYANYYR